MTTDAAMYPTTYVLRTTPAAYLVDDDFPAVTPARLRSSRAAQRPCQ